MKSRTIRAADLFCGAGGASLGLARACKSLGCKLDLLAINHWPRAVETHRANHPGALHLCEDLESVNPRKAVPGGKLDLLLAGPECTHHSTARGGKPVNDQSRASAWCVLRWASALEIDTILIENVREFISWGPLGSNGRPLLRRKGETFRAFLESLRSLGYRVDWRVLNAADFGAATTRQRLFIQAVRGRRAICWPEPTHARKPVADLFGQARPWRPAREIIDWSIPATSIFGRKRPLFPSTLARIAAGLKKFAGPLAPAFLVLLNGGGCKGAGGARSLDLPLPTVTAGGEHVGALVSPFVMTMEHRKPFLVPTNHGSTKGGSDRTYPIDRPMPTITTVDAWALVEPYLVRYNRNRPEVAARSLDEPVPCVDCNDRYGLVLPSLRNCVLDIRFRMLQPHELAAAMSFPPDYVFKGTRSEKVKQIGNAWEGKLSEMLCLEVLRRRAA